MDHVIKILLLVVSCSAFACEYPDEGNMPLRRAVGRIEMRPEVDAWAKAVRRDGTVTQVAVMVGASVRRAGRCYWPVEVRAAGQVWRRFLITPDGKRIIDAGGTPAAASPPAASTPVAPRPASP
jgi:hypothetical protein